MLKQVWFHIKRIKSLDTVNPRPKYLFAKFFVLFLLLLDLHFHNTSFNSRKILKVAMCHYKFIHTQ